MDSQYFSKEGLEKLKAELENRLNVIRPEIAARIKEAKELGDLSENAEYAEAKEAQSLNEGKIEEIKRVLENAVIITEKKHNGTVVVGSKIKVQNNGKARQYTIVGAAESNPQEGYISNESPLGSVFLGRKKGDMVTASTPNGDVQYKIVEIE